MADSSPNKNAPIPNDPPLSEAEIAHIRAVVGPQLEAYRAGKLELLDVEEVFDELEKELFGK